MIVSVFCSSSTRLAPEYIELATTLGNWIGTHAHQLVWGGCNVGLMDVVGRATRAAGGRTTAVVPRFMQDRGLVFEGADEYVFTDTMHARKAVFRERGDAFVALPGGVGTWEEVLEVIALRKLQQLSSPIIIANIRGYYDPLLSQFERSYAESFTDASVRGTYHVADSAADVCEALARAS